MVRWEGLTWSHDCPDHMTALMAAKEVEAKAWSH